MDHINNGPSIRILLIVTNSPFASYSLINLDFLLSQTAYFDKSIVLPFLVFTTFGFLLSLFFVCTSHNTITLFYE